MNCHICFFLRNRQCPLSIPKDVTSLSLATTYKFYCKEILRAGLRWVRCTTLKLIPPSLYHQKPRNWFRHLILRCCCTSHPCTKIAVALQKVTMSTTMAHQDPLCGHWLHCVEKHCHIKIRRQTFELISLDFGVHPLLTLWKERATGGQVHLVVGVVIWLIV